MEEPDDFTRAKIVYLILNKQTERALQVLGTYYRVKPPAVTVGTVKGKRRTAYAVYVRNESKIYAMNSDVFYNPFIILHEFYHHLRSQGGAHRGTEKHADSYAKRFIESYYRIVSERASRVK
jgi:hypothetical protein